QLWAYWFGTGENSKEIYTKEVKGSSGETSDETIKRAYKKAFDKKTMVSKNIFPRQDLFDEAINFVLVDDVNREKFMNDESYVPYKGTMGMFNTQYSRFPFINSMDSNSIPLNACFCNYNKYTPISVHFRYYMGSVEEEIKSVLPSQMNPTPPAQK
ncbi:MAG: hypothetical protein ACPG5P_06580, partial [Saprospiraceae bacterium]